MSAALQLTSKDIGTTACHVSSFRDGGNGHLANICYTWDFITIISSYLRQPGFSHGERALCPPPEHSAAGGAWRLPSAGCLPCSCRFLEFAFLRWKVPLLSLFSLVFAFLVSGVTSGSRAHGVLSHASASPQHRPGLVRVAALHWGVETGVGQVACPLGSPDDTSTSMPGLCPVGPPVAAGHEQSREKLQA